MRKGYLMLLFACLFAVPAFGLCKHENYIGDNDVSGWMWSYYSTWTPGSAPTGGAKNENFFIGRVRPLKRFTNTATQVIQDGTGNITRRANRGLLWWCPINEGSWTSLPRYAFDSEAFSMWSYVTIHGNWTQGFLRQPGAFADVCHKNGVRTACVASIPWAQTLGSTDAGHGQNFKAMITGGANKLMSLLAYYGIDGLGFNSEQEWGDVRDGMKSLLAACHSIKGNFDMTDRLHFDFYSLNNCLTSSGGNMQDFSDFWPSANGFFLNYNWGSTLLNNSETVAGSKSFDVYAGMDMQGRSAADWTSLNNSNISIGIWGAHNKCMPYEGATEDGSTPIAIQNCYLRKCEQLFTGGTQNPVNNLSINNTLCAGNASFFGVSKLMAAKSALSWTVNDYFPFISYLNLGNGKFFNNEGVTTYDNEWYNIGMQDHLPTWRWWITNTYMGRSTSNVPSDTHASFTYEDAWFGGSCLKLTFDNSVSGWRYIQLFKTQFPIADANYTLRVRYKALSGSANMQYTMSKEGDESTIITQAMGTMKAGTGEWQVIEKAVPTNIQGSTMAQLGMRFNNIADGTEILIGEIALVKNGLTYSPVAPVLADSELLKLTSRGVDFRVIWNCPKPAGGGESGGSEPETEAETATRASTMSCTLSGTSTHAERYLTSFSVSGTQGASLASGTIQSGTRKNLYYDLRNTKSLEVKRGETISISPTWNDSWMMGYVYVDWNNDGDFADSGEYMASPYNINGSSYSTSIWAKPKDFTIPADAALGTYTIRYTVDWNSPSGNDTNDQGASYPCGRTSSTASDNYTAANGGCMVDFELHVTASDAGGSSDAWKPVYNDEVDAWYFEIWAQQQGGEPQLVTTTTSWAAYAVEVPFDLATSDKVRIGVRTVAPDGVTKSDIVWTSYLTVPELTIIEGIGVDKPVIKPNEEFTVSFDDAHHAAANYFKILNPDGTLVATFNNVTSFTTTISTKGLYDVEYQYVNQNGATVTETIRALIQVSGPEVGALPEIQTLTTTNPSQKIIDASGVTFDLNYTGRAASGTSSKALRLQEQGFGVKAADINALGVNLGQTAFTIAFWFKPEQFIEAEGGTHFLNVRNPADGWPASDWGFIWSEIGNNGADYNFSLRHASDNAGTKASTTGFNFKAGYWYHMAVVLDRNSSGNRKLSVYVNGASLPVSEDGWLSDVYAWSNAGPSSSSGNIGTPTGNNLGNIIYIGTTAHSRAAFDGYLDEFQIWNKALTAAEVKTVMWHFDAIPTGLIGYWDFEQAPAADGHLNSTGTLSGLQGFVAKQWNYADGTNPDTGESNIVAPIIGAGSPFLAGSFPITTTPSWKYTGTPASQGAVSGNDVAGSTSVTYDQEGEYTATLTLTNPWGSDSKSIQLYVIDGTVDLQGNVIENLNVYPNPFVDALHIQFAKAGEYELEVLSLDGKLVNSARLNAEQGQISRVAVNGETGTYLVRIKQQGTVVQTLKLIKK